MANTKLLNIIIELDLFFKNISFLLYYTLALIKDSYGILWSIKNSCGWLLCIIMYIIKR